MRTLKFLVLICFFYSCSINEKSKQDCFSGQVGKYKFDFPKTNKESGKINLQPDDSAAMMELMIEFKPDSTFVMNRKVILFYDTVGKWDAGTCGFENPGIITYYNSPVKQQFGVCRAKDSFFTIMSSYREPHGSKPLWFKKIHK